MYTRNLLHVGEETASASYFLDRVLVAEVILMREKSLTFPSFPQEFLHLFFSWLATLPLSRSQLLNNAAEWLQQNPRRGVSGADTVR